MEIRELQREKVCSCQEKDCNRAAKYSVFSEGKPHNFFKRVCEPCSDYYMAISRKNRGIK